ncbi:unnamed protein product [Linum trigynum]|uniref:ZF-HD dimerization-type domain-containing protein n=1 Tax=Linum trigynum TaxID=586398 RepID=A0AAV2CXK2_9ROSI
MRERGEGIGDPPAHTAEAAPPRSRRDPTAGPTRSDPEPSAAPNYNEEEEQYSRSGSPPAAPMPAVRYRECMRNHAASSGRHVVDGCGEFMPAGEEGTPAAFRCAACDCHRSFHRQEIDGNHPAAPLPPPPPLALPHPPLPRYRGSTSSRDFPLPPPPPLPPATHNHNPPAVMVSFGDGSSSDDVDALGPSNEGVQQSATASYSRKRFRTRFTQEQKERMAEFAERIGWRIQRQDEPGVQQFCSEIGVERKVFKVWMHNNKQQRRQS